MVGAGRHTVKAIALLIVCVSATGCFWRKYAPRMRTHADLLVSMAHKGVDLVGADRLTAESMPELTYPLERAEAFARDAHARTGDAPPDSLVAFDALVARYRAFVDALDRDRREQRGKAAADALAAPLAEVVAAADTVRSALATEH
jgi:hypothetical protein